MTRPTEVERCRSSLHSRRGHIVFRIVKLMLAAVVLKPSAFTLFAQSRTVSRTLRLQRLLVREAFQRSTGFNKHLSDYEAFQGNDCKFRDVKVTDLRDLNALLSLPDPCAPSEDMLLLAVTLDDGFKLERPIKEDLQKLNPTKLRPIICHWSDRSKVQYWAPSKYEELIQKMLNSAPSELEEVVRANWKAFDKGFYFKIQSLRSETSDPRLKEKLTNLEKLTMEVLKTAQKASEQKTPEQAQDAEAIINSMLEDDGQTLLWPPNSDAYARLAEEITKRATRAKFEDGWFETILEILERLATKMEAKNDKQIVGCTQIAMQRVITEWLREDTLWEETEEGRFLFRLMSLSHDQWPLQLVNEENPLDAGKLKDEIKIISENKVVNLPMGSKLQIYASKYLKGLLDFVSDKEKILGSIEASR
mmetsp:Transcript_81252/g.143308  ORF Transcript_81252/g.143308 Transcript_81252/m.143308 type:complete len:419 (-) Transcript_81252:79-1335(-)|eukprot:CAMPEP_0197652870 /NCGR_PEP_ID=MMETSP1338-20131121/34709_1 /TAXON_ID=43686 ORGANISM="Pelagodinium beii, Strain RCC1491" /NCGR_SAMPLE_ID=MMETSP1338 /ASSEMBLY_ACC=CAM_ASM_000754 /LENGTH=418 /DNA_ID=CAMNT_0043227829 /DNA_START=61 /DNA_END=1317 /DNA_ORIENTATION=-